MAKDFHPPFQLDADFYDKDGNELEWAYWWGDCPDAANVVWRVVDTYGTALSSHNTREKAEAALKQTQNPRLVED